MHHSVIELRRYAARPGKSAAFGRLFETWFPEVFRQLGAVVFGHFVERGGDRFAWLRGYADMEARLAVNTAFYDGPVWAEHKAALNGLVLDTDDVLLLQPALPETGVPVLPAVDPTAGPARGLAAALVCPVREEATAAFAMLARATLDACRTPDMRPAGVLRTLAAPNNFPRHPIRAEGSWVVLLCVLRDEAALAGVRTALGRLRESGEGMLEGPCELVVLEPCAQSRLRWTEQP